MRLDDNIYRYKAELDENTPYEISFGLEASRDGQIMKLTTDEGIITDNNKILLVPVRNVCSLQFRS